MPTGPTSYRFGALSCSLADIARIGRAHGRDGILYYPPPCWGQDAPRQPRSIALTGLDIPGETYLSAYRRGYHDRPR